MFTQRFRLFFYSTGYVALYTGFLLIFFLTKPADFFPVWRHVLLKSHIVSVVLWLFSCGMLFSIHVISQLQARIETGKKSGIWLIVLLALMSLSGYAIQVMPGAKSLDVARWLHVFSGSGFTVLLVSHLLLIKASVRIWLLGALVLSLALAAPFALLKQTDTIPDEIQLTPKTDIDPQKKSP